LTQVAQPGRGDAVLTAGVCQAIVAMKSCCETQESGLATEQNQIVLSFESSRTQRQIASKTWMIRIRGSQQFGPAIGFLVTLLARPSDNPLRQRQAAVDFISRKPPHET
jgi:hypothetical protein